MFLRVSAVATKLNAKTQRRGELIYNSSRLRAFAFFYRHSSRRREEIEANFVLRKLQNPKLKT
jgi:hypothetical protein